jgi:uncharacterized protein
MEASTMPPCPHLLSHEQQHLVQLITSTSTAIEKLFLLGSTVMQRRTQTIFHSNQPTCRYTGHYYVLVLVSNTGDHSLNNIRDTIEARSQQWIPTTAIVLAIETFTGWLNEGNPFARWVVQQATLMYNANDHVLPQPGTHDETKLEAENKKLLNETKQKVQSFLAGAELYRIRKEYKLAAFMLHQAAEQQLRTMLIIKTGLCINTHNIERLIRYNCMWCDKLLEIFPKNNQRSQRLFTLLQKAYVDARYNPGYTITLDELEALEQKIKHLLHQLKA